MQPSNLTALTLSITVIEIKAEVTQKKDHVTTIFIMFKNHMYLNIKMENKNQQLYLPKCVKKKRNKY